MKWLNVTHFIYTNILITQIKREEIIMSEKCELLETCGFFLNFKGNPEVLHAGWINLYCESKEKSEKCKRKEIRKQTGKASPDNMTPSGKIIK